MPDSEEWLTRRTARESDESTSDVADGRTHDDPKDAIAAALQERYQTASTEFLKLRNDLTLAVDARQKLEAQFSELNELVKKEFAALTPDNTIYKLVGPVLVQQHQALQKHSRTSTHGLDFIQGEITRVEGQLKNLLGAKSEKTKLELDQVLASSEYSAFRALRTVEFASYVQDSDETLQEEHPILSAWAQRALPKLHERGITEVHVYNEDYVFGPSGWDKHACGPDFPHAYPPGSD